MLIDQGSKNKIIIYYLKIKFKEDLQRYPISFTIIVSAENMRDCVVLKSIFKTQSK